MSEIHSAYNTAPQVGLALAGGGVSGSAAIGVIQALQEAGIEITHIAGTSSGAMVAALHAYGYSVEQIKQAIPRFNKRHLDVDWKAVIGRLFRRPRYLDGWIKGAKLHALIDELTGSSPLTSLQIPCGIVSFDLREGEPFIFSNVPIAGFNSASDASVADAVRASCAIPVVFQPVRWSGHVLADGGIAMNCPVSVVRAMGAKHVIAVDTVTVFANEDVGQLRSGLSIFAHTINLTLRNQMAAEHEQASISLYPHVGYVGAFSFNKVSQCVEAGYRCAQEKIADILVTCGERPLPVLDAER